MRDLNEIEKNRVAKADRMRARGEQPYPARAQRTHTVADALLALEQALQAGAPVQDSGVPATLCGRLRSMRTMGKLTFAHMEDVSGRVQLLLRSDEVGADRLRHFDTDFDLGDFVQATGVLMRTKTGEFTLRCSAVVMLAKSVSPLPAAKEAEEDGHKVVYSAFANPEARYRERYADLAVNTEVREIFRVRAAVVRALRNFLDERGFLEVETPVLQPIYGGAAARPFVTHHNQLHQDLFLRISFELYLKRLLVGGLESVYEIGRDFRNEGVSLKHNPEFTQLEFYCAYADYAKVMEITEEMLAFVAQQVCGSTTLEYEGHKINLQPPWRRVALRTAVAEACGIDIAAHPTAATLAEAMRASGQAVDPAMPRGKLIESLLALHVEPLLIQPTFVHDFPRDISPLAKATPGDPHTVERFEAYIAGMELCNAFSELNDPQEQAQRFEEMQRDHPKGEEAHPMDEDYLRALQYGMPPCGGFGMGVDRLTMLLTGQRNIREVILFPHLRTRE